MRILMLFSLLLCVGRAGLADPLADKARLLQPPNTAISDASGRFALQAGLAQTRLPTKTRDGRFALLADFDLIIAAPPGDGRYTLSSKLGNTPTTGTCGSVEPIVFRNGFEN